MGPEAQAELLAWMARAIGRPGGERYLRAPILEPTDSFFPDPRTCGWIPDGGAHWGCDECDADDFNTLEHGGRCPGCKKEFDDTLCPKCENLAPYEWWWPSEED